MMLEKKVNTTPVNYVVLNQLSQYFKTRFVPQTKLSAEQAFWSQNSMISPEPTPSSRPTKVEVPKELPKVSMSQKKDMVIKKLKERIKSLSGNMKEDKIKKELKEIETINIELDHRVTKLIVEIVQIVLRYLESDCSKHMTGDRSQLTNFIDNFLGLRHNLFSIGQFHDSDLEVTFRQHTCFIRNLKGVNLLTESRGNDLYTMSLRDMMASSPICLLSKASKTKSWLWHRRLSYLNFSAINHLSRQGLVWGLPKVKFEKDHLCSACAMGKSKKNPTNLNLKTPTKKNSIFCTCIFVDQCVLKVLMERRYVVSIVFDELLTPPPSVDHPTPKVIAPITEVVAPKPAASTSSPFLTTVDQDAPSPSNSQTTPKTQSSIILNDVEEDNHDLDVEPMNNDPFFEVYVSQQDRFVDTDKPNHVYKLKKALYGLKQAPCAWYDMLSSFLIFQDFSKGLVDPTMFIRKDNKELLLVQIYVDDIIFDASTPKLCDKYGSESCDSMDTPMVEKSKLDEDKEGKSIDSSHYRGMIGTLLYLNSQ
nr:integrase, catalytic region, zinc finger, CCHC-type, peptidase aspartic, catalytic [Tanacetum cinerariifolium]